jgi:hypothetical protein
VVGGWQDEDGQEQPCSDYHTDGSPGNGVLWIKNGGWQKNNLNLLLDIIFHMINWVRIE